MITLQQDAHDKVKITLDVETILIRAKRFFNWRKVTIERVNSLGTYDYDRFIKYLSKN